MSNWEIIKNQARKNQVEKTAWTSFKRGKRYQVESVSNEQVIIKRFNGKNTKIAEQITENFVKDLRQQGVLERNQIKKEVAKTCALIHLHPNIVYKEERDEIIWENIIVDLKSIELIISEAPDDDIQKIERLVNKRSYQSFFKQNLMSVYEGRCVISAVMCPYVLEASHISPHSKSHNNRSNNGLLLRADLHKLFDLGLLQIHPINLTIHISPELTEDQYTKYEGKVIGNRIDGEKPDELLLQEKWNSVSWTKGR